VDRAREPDEVHLVGVRDDGDDETLFQRHRDPEVDMLLESDLISHHGSVEDRKLLERLHRSFGDRRGETWRNSSVFEAGGALPGSGRCGAYRTR
jgi:hypothetical protein